MNVDEDLTNLPQVGQQVLLRVTYEGATSLGKFEHRQKDRLGRCVGRPYYFTAGFGMEVRPVAWAPLPSIFDERWIVGKPDTHSRKRVLVLGHYADKPLHGYIAADICEPLAFPGILGGPMHRFDGVVAWMPWDVAFGSGFTDVPSWVNIGPSSAETWEALKRRWIDNVSGILMVEALNDSEFHSLYSEKLVSGDVVAFGRYKKVTIEDFIRYNSRGEALYKHITAEFRRRIMTPEFTEWREMPESSIDKVTKDVAMKYLQQCADEFVLNGNREMSCGRGAAS